MKRSASLRDFLIVLFKYKYRILFVLFSTLTTIAAGTWMFTPIYEASSVLMVKFGREYVYLKIGDSATPYNYFNREGLINAEIEILMSRELKEKCINAIGLDTLYPDLREKAPKDIPIMDVALEKLGKNLSAQGSKDSGIINIAFRHPDPKLAVKFVDLLVDLFKEKHLVVFGDPETSVFLVEKMKTYQSLLERTEKEIETYKKENEAFSLKEQQRLLLTQRSELESALNINIRNIAESKEKLVSLERQMASRTQSSSIYDDTVKKRDNEVTRGIEDAIVSTRSGLSSHKVKTAVIQKQLEQVDAQLQTLTDREKELLNLERKFTVNEQNYLIYQKKVEEARIQDEMNRMKLTNIRVVQTAIAPQKPVLPRKGINLTVGFVLGLMGGIGLAAFQEILSQGFSSRESVEKRLGLPVLSTIAYKK